MGIKRTQTLSAVILGSLLALSGCSQDKKKDESVVERTTNEVLTESSPWATTGVFLHTDGIPDKSTNYIDDSAISSGTISSAQYRNGIFIFVGLSDHSVGSFDEASLIQSLDDVASNNANPEGLSYGDYEIIDDGQGNSIRRIRNASFAPTAVIDRTVTVANAQEFGYIFTAQDGLTYYVEHKPYTEAFQNTTYPAEVQSAINAFFDAKLTEEKRIDYVLRTSSPWATTAIYLQVNGEIDNTTNFISDSTISAGTISSAQYRDGKFMFVGMSDFTTGEFELSPLVTSLTSDGASQPNGFSYGDYEIINDGLGNPLRRITNASFAPTATIDRTVTIATADLFTYTFEKDGSTYYVEHKPYAQAFPTATYPQELQTAIDQFFSAL